jgi:N-methylhydantoinase A
MTTVMNAYVGERMRGYLVALQAKSGEVGLGARPLVTRSNGGILNIETAGKMPVHTMLSGPAAGVVGARYCAERAGFKRIITWDMGGTSLDVAVMDGNIRHTEEASVGEHPLFVPTVDVISIGAGGGSIAWVDPVGMLHVGPRSAGAKPGPACYGRGGTEPTLTDAYVALGIIDPANFADGELPLNRENSMAALTRLGEKLGMSALAAGEAVLEVATAQIQTKCMPLLARYGIDPDEYALLPYGGAGPTHAFLYAKAAGIRRLVVPLFPGLLCALGTVIADLRFDAPRRVEIALDTMDEDAFNAMLAELGDRAVADLQSQRVKVRDIDVVRSASMRYVGQSFELEIDLPEDRIDCASAKAAFLEGYQARYGYSDPNAPIEIVSVVAHAIGHTPKPNLVARVEAAPKTERNTRPIYHGGRWVDAEAMQRTSLRPGDHIRGPAVIDQADTTTFVPPGFDVRVDEQLNLIGELIDDAV